PVRPADHGPPEPGQRHASRGAARRLCYGRGQRSPAARRQGVQAGEPPAPAGVARHVQHLRQRHRPHGAQQQHDAGRRCVRADQHGRPAQDVHVRRSLSILMDVDVARPASGRREELVRRFTTFMGAGAAIGLVALSVLPLHSQGKTVEWRYFGADRGFPRYSPADQITRDNVKDLRIAWRRPATTASFKEAFPQLRVNAYLRATPIMVDGMLYTQDVHGFVSAFDAGSGDVVWQQEPFARTEEELQGQSTRGVDYWRDSGDQRTFAVRGEYLYALNAKTGKPYADFGDRGRASLHFDDHQPLAGRFNDSTGPLVVGNVVVVTGNTAGAGDGGVIKEAAPENVRGFDAKSGKLLWTFNVVPQPGEA